MQENKNGVITFKEYEDFLNNEKEKKKLRKEAALLTEEIKAKEECLKELKKGFLGEESMYMFAEPAVRAHKYWASEDFLYIAEIEKVFSPHYVKYLVSTPDEVNSPHGSSTLGVLWNYPVPITKEKYDELMLLMLPQDEYDKLTKR